MMMQLKVLLPTRVLLDEPVTKVVAEAEDGSFCLLPRHVDFVTTLTSGVLSYWTAQGERFVAVEEGTLVKCGAQVLVSTRNAAACDDLAALQATVTELFAQQSEQDRAARTALARLEAATMRRFLELEVRMHG
jgi:F-type H+-transporting ATPase subunit epsilon